jgi:APA family basic amino acid/polyamine antiporter
MMHPEKNIPKATLYGTLIATFIYIASTVSIMGMIPSNQLQHSVTDWMESFPMTL